MERSKVAKLFFILIVSFLMPKNVDAQIIEVGASAGMSYYMGDINPIKPLCERGLGLGAVVRYYDDTRFAFRLQYSNSGLRASDVKAGYMPERQCDFKGRANDVAFLAEYNFFDYWTGSKRDYITPYIFGGLSYMFFNTESNAPKDIDYTPEKSKASIPFGVGVKYSLGERIGMTMEWRMNKTFTDDIDGINNQKYISEYDKDGNPIYKNHKLGYQCDWVGVLEMSFVYRFNLPKKDACHSGIKARLK